MTTVWNYMSEREVLRHEFYMGTAELLRTLATCQRGQVGAVLVSDRRIIATGYNGAPPGLPHCLEVGCLTYEGEAVAEAPAGGCQRAVHAEANVLAFAARNSGGARGSTLFSTHGPCLKCAQLIASAGVETVVFQTPYRLPDGVQLLKDADIAVYRWDPEERCRVSA